LIDLDDLRNGRVPGIEADVGACLAQAAIICLEDNHHADGISMKIDGSLEDNLEVRWRPLTDPAQARRSWDPDDATEWGASGVATLVIDRLTDYRVVERAKKWVGERRGSGFDYWLGRKDEEARDLLFQGKARLEVSGIRSGSESDLAARVRKKEVQTQQSDWLRLDAYVAVVEFSAPRARVIKR
jgi:hypothetical protein